MAGLFDGVFGRGAAAAAVEDDAWLQALLDVEAGLARALAAAGVIPAAEAEAVAAACRAQDFDAATIGAQASATGNPVPPLVAALTARVGGDAGRSVHRGATSQDVLDSAAMLVTRRALRPLLADLRTAADAAAALARAHRDTPIAGRTLLQQALPTTFGLKAAGWTVALDEGRAALRGFVPTAQLGGAAGTLASLGEAGPAVLRALATELDLAEPLIPWHTLRGVWAVLAGALGAAAGAVAKVARDLVLLSQTEVAEVHDSDPARGGSSTMPHKRNPVAAVAALACARQVPALAATLFAAAEQEHERAAGAWHTEWPALSGALRATGSGAAWLADALTHLEADPARMRANLDATGGALLAERVVTALTPALGRLPAHERIERAVRSGRPLLDALADDGEIAAHLDRDALAALLDPGGYLGSATLFVDRALAAHDAMEDR